MTVETNVVSGLTRGLEPVLLQQHLNSARAHQMVIYRRHSVPHPYI